MSDPRADSALVQEQQQVTRLLRQAQSGSGGSASDAAQRLFPLVYDRLKQLARQRMNEERSGHTLQATALVHEAYVRLVGGSESIPWTGRSQFFFAAAEAMRRIRSTTLVPGGPPSAAGKVATAFP